MSWSKTDQESRLEAVFAGLEADFKRLDKAKNPEKAQALLKDVTAKLKDAKALIQEFEREARTDGMPSRELADRKRRLVNQFNEYVNLKKQHSSTEAGRGELLAGAGMTAGQEEAEAGGSAADGMTMQELMKEGRKGVKEIDGTLNRAEKLVEDTLQIGQQTAATLHDQTQQLNKVVDDLNEIEFTMKKATKIIADIGKGIMTDRCIMFLLFLVVCGVIALVVVKVVKPNAAAIQAATPDVIKNATNTALSNVPGLGHHRHRALLMDQPAVKGMGASWTWLQWSAQQQQQQQPQQQQEHRSGQEPCLLGHHHHSTQHNHDNQQDAVPKAADAAAGHSCGSSFWLLGAVSTGRADSPRKLAQRLLL